MSDKTFKCGCEAGYREVVTGDLKDYVRAPKGGVALEIAMDPCGTMYLGSDQDESWAEANLGKHLAITITQLPKQGPRVVDIGVLEGRTSELYRKAARIGGLLGVSLVKAGDGLWHMHIPKGAIPEGHPILKELEGRDVLPLPDEAVDMLDAKLQKIKRDQGDPC